MIAGGVPSSTSDDEASVDSEMASPADLAGSSRLTLLGLHSRPLLEWRLRPLLLGCWSRPLLEWHLRPFLLGWRSQLLLGRHPWPVLRWQPSTDRMEAAGSRGVCGSRSSCDCLSLHGYVTDSDAVVLPDGVELGNPAVVALPMTGFAQPVAA